MGIFLIKRFATFVVTLLAASVLVFAVQGLLPGNAAQMMLGESATPEAVEVLSRRLGLDQPAAVRYGRWVAGLVTGDLGTSVAYDAPVAQLIGERLAVTAPLALLAMALTTALALALGLYAASHHGR
ncbi:MAG TPA: ABC transporter permease, partial [Burkholderiaceae bacterium]|nr:ABC transporter permease [Burkholderiaceae bacterium]